MSDVVALKPRNRPARQTISVQNLHAGSLRLGGWKPADVRDLLLHAKAIRLGGGQKSPAFFGTGGRVCDRRSGGQSTVPTDRAAKTASPDSHRHGGRRPGGRLGPDAGRDRRALAGYTILSAAQWPLLESLISIGANAGKLSRRISIYNLVWSGSGAITVAACGVVIAHFPQGIFLTTAGAHLIALLLLAQIQPQPRHSSAAHLHPEPELLPLRTLANALSRIALSRDVRGHLRAGRNHANALSHSINHTRGQNIARQRLDDRAMDLLRLPRRDDLVAHAPPPC